MHYSDVSIAGEVVRIAADIQRLADSLRAKFSGRASRTNNRLHKAIDTDLHDGYWMSAANLRTQGSTAAVLAATMLRACSNRDEKDP